jgi:hypothetical protein
MSKPIYIGITQNPPKIVSIGETIDGMKMVDILLDNENIDNITSQLQLEFEELSNLEGIDSSTEVPIEESEPEVLVDTPTVDESPTEEAVAADVSALTASPIEEAVAADVLSSTEVPEQLALTPASTEVVAPEALALTAAPTEISAPEALTLTSTPTEVVAPEALALTSALTEISAPETLALTPAPLIGAGLKPKKHKITKRYKNRLLKRRKTKRIHT